MEKFSCTLGDTDFIIIPGEDGIPTELQTFLSFLHSNYGHRFYNPKRTEQPESIHYQISPSTFVICVFSCIVLLL